MRTIEWSPDSSPVYEKGYDSGAVRTHLDLTEVYGEREFLRHGFARDVDDDGTPELVVRTMNANRARAIDLEDGSTVWLSPDVDPPPRESVQISDLHVGDLDGDGDPEVLLATYQGSVICLDATDGSVAWHRRLGFLINNSALGIDAIVPGSGGNVALTVARGTDPSGPSPYWRNNLLFHPRLLVLDRNGEIVLLTDEYATDNSAGHYTWTGDVDGDGYHEVACIGEREVVWFDGTGERLFAMPSSGEGGHPDDLHVVDLYPDSDGKEIVYLDGHTGVNVYSSSGEPLHERTFPGAVASHLQLLAPRLTPAGPRIVGCNIRAPGSKLLLLDGELDTIWALESGPDLMHPLWFDWDRDGEREIVVGSRTDHVDRCCLRVMDRDGAPRYWQRIRGHDLCVPIEAADLDGDGREELVVAVGDKDGPDGRWSLPDGTHMHLLVVDPEDA
jgi:outer membrane protein assembly factor BamB